jgi:hypothetical protein
MNPSKGFAWIRYLLVMGIVVPLVMLLTACSGGGGTDPITDPNPPIDQQNHFTTNESLKACNNYTQDQFSSANADILVVMDNSGSMGSEQTLLAQGLGALIDAIPLGNDFHFGVVTTDMDLGNPGQQNPLLAYGNLIGPVLGSLPNKWLDPAVANVVNEMKLDVAPGVTGSGSERGLDAAYAALVNLSGVGGYNEGFLRDNAFLNILIVSDEEDQSLRSVSDYYAGFNLLKGTNWTAHAIVHTDANTLGCLPPISTDAVGQRYMDFIDMINNGATPPSIPATKSDLCPGASNSWASILTSIGQGIATLQSCFNLAIAHPKLDTIDVTLNGTAMTQGTQWEYDAAQNRICSVGSAMLVANSDIKVCAVPLLEE